MPDEHAVPPGERIVTVTQEQELLGDCCCLVFFGSEQRLIEERGRVLDPQQVLGYLAARAQNRNSASMGILVCGWIEREFEPDGFRQFLDGSRVSGKEMP